MAGDNLASVGKRRKMNKAVFLDRDGVLNPLVYNLQTGEYESPHRPGDFSVYPSIASALHLLADAGFLLFLVSNQPSYAKGKTSLENIQAIQQLLDQYLRENQIAFAEYYYCYHHPDGVVPGYSGTCECRKPKAFFLQKAAQEYHLDFSQCWMIGDQDTDVQCGQNAGVYTIQIVNPHSAKKRGSAFPNCYAENLAEAVDIIVNKQVLGKG